MDQIYPNITVSIVLLAADHLKREYFSFCKPTKKGEKKKSKYVCLLADIFLKIA